MIGQVVIGWPIWWLIPGCGVVACLVVGRVCSGCVKGGVCLLLFYTIATVFQLYHGGDTMYEVRRRKTELTLLPTQRIFNISHHSGMV